MDENMKAAGAVLFADAGRNGGEIFLRPLRKFFLIYCAKIEKIRNFAVGKKEDSPIFRNSQHTIFQLTK